MDVVAFSKDYAPILVASAAVFSAIAAVSSALLARRSRQAQEKALNYTSDALETNRQGRVNSAFIDFILRGYLDREFSATEPPKVGKRTISNLRHAKKILSKSLSPAGWNEESCKEGTPENRVAYELSIALERLGIAVFTGVMPINFFLAVASDQVVDDWVYCHAWVEDYRDKQRVVGFERSYHRRHAEWLAYLSIFWLDRRFSTGKLASDFFSSIKVSNDDAVKLMVKYSCQELDLMPPNVQRIIEQVAEVELFPHCTNS